MRFGNVQEFDSDGAAINAPGFFGIFTREPFEIRALERGEKTQGVERGLIEAPAAEEIEDAFAFGVSGVGESRDQIEAGELRVLGVTSGERMEGIDGPTLKESGVDVEFTNWRGIVAPPGISEVDQQRLIDLFTELQNTQQWKDALERNGWTKAFQTGDEFGEFLDAQNDQVANVLTELGL